MILGVILFDALARMIAAPGFNKFVYVMTAILQIGAIFLLILSAGGLTVRDLAGDLADTFEVIRRGGEEKEIIIPRSGQTPRPRGGRDDDEDRPARIDLDAELRASHPPPPVAPSATRPPENRSAAEIREDDDRGIPLA
jgi:hypothetical protein